MRRALAVVAVGFLPVLAWTAASAGPEPPVDCTSPTTTAGSACVSPAPAAAVEPAPAPTTTAPAPDPAPTTSPTTGGSTTTVAPPTSQPTTSTTTPGTDTTVPPPSSDPSTTVDPGASTTVDPAASTTVDPGVTTTTIEPAPPVEDSDSAPVAPPAEVPSGRIGVPAGAAETGQVRPITFPVAGPVSYFNDWGACRDGCARAHKGNDLIGDRRQPVLAMRDGVVDHLVDHPTAGYGVVIRDDEGWEYHVYHLNNDSPGTDDGADDGTWRFLPGVVAGARVTAGQVIGWMGDSGNSEGSVPHAHVEIHLPDGTAINPYWSLRAAQRAANCAVGTVGQPAPVVAGATAAASGDAAAADGADPAGPGVAALASAAAPEAAGQQLEVTTEAAAPSPGDGWLAAGWSEAALPAGWSPLAVSGGRPGSGDVAARMWVSPAGFTPVDAAALRVGDARYDEGVDCSVIAEPATVPAELTAVLAAIRHMESRGDYTVSARGSSASGAYGFLDSTWGGYGGYARAKDAPPSVQDAKAAEWAMSILDRNGGDVATIPVSWYIGHVPVGAEWDTVPRPDAGNRITPREYQTRWLAVYAQLLGDPAAAAGAGGGVSTATVDTSSTCRTVVVDVGAPGAPQYVLTQAQSFLAAPDGRAVPDAIDPCDPGRALHAAAPPTAPVDPSSSAQEALAKLEEPVGLATGGPR